MNGYPENWDEIRKQVLERDDYECRNCGVQGGPDGNATLQAHHIVPLRDDGNNTMSNLATLCLVCHEKVHPHMRDTPEASKRTSNKPKSDLLRRNGSNTFSAHYESNSTVTSSESNQSSSQNSRTKDTIRSTSNKQDDSDENSDNDDISKFHADRYYSQHTSEEDEYPYL